MTRDMENYGYIEKIYNDANKSSYDLVVGSLANSTLTKEKQEWTIQVNNIIQNGDYAFVDLKDTRSVTSEMLKYVTDLSKLSVRMDLALSDLNGNLKPKYEKNKYRERVTYTGNETYIILKKLEELDSLIDISLPITQRAKQIYDIISKEIKPKRLRANTTREEWLVCQSLRGIVSNNIVGEEGLVCAGYSTLFKELCSRNDIQCDYIRGKVITTSGRRGSHAWNVFIDEYNRPIPVDVTFHVTSNKDWFGGSQKFQEGHIPEDDEIFKDYLTEAYFGEIASEEYHDYDTNNGLTEEDKYNIIQNVLTTMNHYYGPGSGISSLFEYINTNDISVITNLNEARETIKYISPNELYNYLSFQINIIENIIIIMDEIYGPGRGVKALRDYINTGNPRTITRQNDARKLLRQVSLIEIEEYLQYAYADTLTMDNLKRKG